MPRPAAPDGARVSIRPYEAGDAAATLAVFIAAVTETAAADYSPEQVRAWARPDQRDEQTWHAAMSSRASFVATIDGVVAGFSDVSATGYIDMLFVAPAYQRRGVAHRLLAHARSGARARGATELTASASLTARTVFEKFGFEAAAHEQAVTAGVSLTRVSMRMHLVDARAEPGARAVRTTATRSYREQFPEPS